jgi:hypothetical protein
MDHLPEDPKDQVRSAARAASDAPSLSRRDTGIVKGWMDSALLATENNFRKIMGYRDLWALRCDPRWIEVCCSTRSSGVVTWH